MSAEKVDGKHLIGLPLLISDILEPFKLDKCLRAFFVAFIEVT